MIDSELPPDLRRRCTPTRGPTFAVLAHPLTNGIAPVLGADPRSGAPRHRIPRRQSESIIERASRSRKTAASMCRHRDRRISLALLQTTGLRRWLGDPRRAATGRRRVPDAARNPDHTLSLL